jgi:hypothetical protein
MLLLRVALSYQSIFVAISHDSELMYMIDQSQIDSLQGSSQPRVKLAWIHI